MSYLAPALKNAVYFFTRIGVSRRQLTAALLISIFITPATFGSSLTVKRGAGQSPISLPIPVPAPPEPFVVSSKSRLSILAAGLFSRASGALDALTSQKTLPEGLGAARTPSIGERLVAPFAPVLGFLKPSTRITASSATASAPPQPSSVVDFDFDNDGKADIGRWNAAGAEFKVRNSNGGSYSDFIVGCAPPASGCSGQVIAPGDFNGDGKTDAAVFKAGTWTYKTSPTATAQTITWGTGGDIPVAGDYDGDGISDAAIYRPSTNTWWVSKSNELTFESGFRSGADASYVSSLRGDGADGNTLGFTHGENGSEYGGVHIGRLNQLANNLWFNSRATPENRFEALTAEGRGRALGRIIAHEVVAHYLLSLSNAEHTGSGLTRAAFGNEIFDEAASNQFLISSVQNAQLFLRCSRKRIPDNYAE